MLEIILTSNSLITIVLNNSKIEVSNINKKVLKLENPKSLNFDFYFTNSPAYMFHANCEYDEFYKTNSEQIKVIKLSDKKYIFKFLLKNECFLQKKCKKIVKNEQIFNFYQNGLVEIETQNTLNFSKQYDFKIVDASVIELKNNYVALKLFGEYEEEKTIVLNDNFAEILLFDSAMIESNETGFKVLTNLYDIAGHGVVEVFEIDEDIKKVDEYTVYMQTTPQREFNLHVLPIYFLECIRARDYKEASSCLSTELKNKAKPEHLAQYFGDFVDIYVLENKIYLEYVDASNNYFARQFNFAISNDKISSIS